MRRAFVPLRRRRRRLRRIPYRGASHHPNASHHRHTDASPKSRARTTPSPSPPSPAAPSSRSLRRRARRPFLSRRSFLSRSRPARVVAEPRPRRPRARVPAGRAAPPAESRTARPPRAANPPAARRGACSRAPCSARQRTPRTRPRSTLSIRRGALGDEPERAVRARAGDVPGGHRAHLHVRLALLQQSELVRRERGVARAQAVHQPREYLRRVRAERRGPEPVREDPTRRAPRARGGSNPSPPAPGEAPATLIARPRVRERARRHPSRITMRSERVFVRVYVQ